MKNWARPSMRKKKSNFVLKLEEEINRNGPETTVLFCFFLFLFVFVVLFCGWEKKLIEMVLELWFVVTFVFVFVFVFVVLF